MSRRLPGEREKKREGTAVCIERKKKDGEDERKKYNQPFHSGFEILDFRGITRVILSDRTRPKEQ